MVRRDAPYGVIWEALADKPPVAHDSKKSKRVTAHRAVAPLPFGIIGFAEEGAGIVGEEAS